MNRDKLGNKHLCTSCGIKFFDLNKEVPTCPKCNTELIIRVKPRLGRPPLNKNLKKPEAKVINNEPIPNNENETIKEDDIEINEDIDNLVSLEELDEDTESMENSETDLNIISEDDNEENLSGITDIELNDDEEN